MRQDPPALALPTALRLVEPVAQRLLAGIVLGPLLAAFLGRPLVWLALPLGFLVALGILSCGGRFGPNVLVDRRGVWRDRELLLPRAAIDFAYVAQQEEGALVRFFAGGEVTAELEVWSAEEGARVLEAMRLGPGARVVRLGSTLPASVAHALGWVATLLGLGGVVAGLAFGAPSIVAVGVMALFVAPGLLQSDEVRVGADGLTITSGFKTRFVSYGDVVGVEECGRGLVVHLVGGGRVFAATPARLWSAPRREVRGALVEAVRAELTRYRALPPPASASRIEAAFGEGRVLPEGNFRVAPMPVETLVEIAACPTASERARELASRALSSVEEEWAREELERAADACASPALRSVLSIKDSSGT